MYRQKARDAILAVTIFGSLLLLPPVLPYFDREISVLGMPLIVVYVFGVWLALIGAAWALSRRLPANGTRAPQRYTAARDTLESGTDQ